MNTTDEFKSKAGHQIIIGWMMEEDIVDYIKKLELKKNELYRIELHEIHEEEVTECLALVKTEEEKT